MQCMLRLPTPLLLLFALMTGVMATPATTIVASTMQSQASTALPPARLDALDPAQWSVSTLIVAPGQTIQITNRGILPHTFAVAEWGVDSDLPTLETIEITVPSDLRPGDSFTFYCSIGDHRSEGQEGTILIVSPEDALATATSQNPEQTGTIDVSIEMSDTYRFTPADISVAPGQIISLRNSGVLEHHFVVDEWNVNVTVGPGESSFVQVPEDVTPGQSFTFYCSMPGHRDKGEEGSLHIVESQGIDRTGSSRSASHGPDLSRFIPEASLISPEWQQVRTGNARAIVPELESLNVKIFPGEGRSAAYIGPNGSRAAIVVLPLVSSAAPTNQIAEAISSVQLAMMKDWETSGNGARYENVPTPEGCDVVERIDGITTLYTLPAGSTSCQLRGSGIVIFVVVEGEVGNAASVEASDLILTRLLAHAAGS